MYQAYGRAVAGRARQMPPGQPPPPPPPPPYGLPYVPPLPGGANAQQHGQQVNLGPTPSFRKLSETADLEEREDWMEHFFSKLQSNGSGIRLCFSGPRQLMSTPWHRDYADIAARQNALFTNVNVVVPFAVFKDHVPGQTLTTVINDTAGNPRNVPIPHDIFQRISSQVYALIKDELPYASLI